MQLRLNGISSQYTWLEETREIRILLEDLHLAILRLRQYPQFMQRDDAENLIKSAEEWITLAITEQKEIERRILSKSSLPLPDFETEATHDDTPWSLITILWPQKEHSSESPTADIGKQLQTSLKRWLFRNITPKYLPCQIILVRRTALFEALELCNLNIAWGIWLNREPAYPLIHISGKKKMFRNWYAVAFWNADSFKFISYKDEI